MKKKNIAILVLLTFLIVGISFTLTGCSESEHKKMTSWAKHDIVDTAVSADDFNTLVAAVKAAGLVETLKSKGPFTVFAPTDEAFGKLPHGTLDSLLKPANKGKLVSILTYHVVPGKVMAADVVNLDHAKTVNGQSLSIKTYGGTVKVDKANVIKTDIECSNGVIHVIDAVVLPK
ncbi:MAG TPA: fasciclin domain-containing protein [Planctomycetes bacterium]|nr:fasciclin domain-containing protein [Planctomycetota bacterium]